jgi:hypothetical protein
MPLRASLPDLKAALSSPPSHPDIWGEWVKTLSSVYPYRDEERTPYALVRRRQAFASVFSRIPDCISQVARDRWIADEKQPPTPAALKAIAIEVREHMIWARDHFTRVQPATEPHHRDEPQKPTEAEIERRRANGPVRLATAFGAGRIGPNGELLPLASDLGASGSLFREQHMQQPPPPPIPPTNDQIRAILTANPPTHGKPLADWTGADFDRYRARSVSDEA